MFSSRGPISLCFLMYLLTDAFLALLEHLEAYRPQCE